MTGRSTRPRPGGAASFHEICTLRIELVGSDPLIWRELDVPTSVTLKVLHDIVQAGMGWFDVHLWEFTIDGRRYGPPMEEDRTAEPRRMAARVRLRDVLAGPTTTIDYLYDFGDSWEHRLTVGQVRQGDPDTEYPRYVAGAQSGPPEDCGGLPGFYAMLDALADPDHPDHDAIADWLDDYDPDVIDDLPMRYALSRIARQRNAARKRLARRAEQSAPH